MRKYIKTKLILKHFNYCDAKNGAPIADKKSAEQITPHFAGRLRALFRKGFHRMSKDRIKNRRLLRESPDNSLRSHAVKKH